MTKRLLLFRLCLPLVLLGVAGCLPTGGVVTSTARMQASTGALTPEPRPPAPERMWMSDYLDDARRIEGAWAVIYPRDTRCEIEFAQPNLASRTGRIRRQGPCFGPLFTTQSWTVSRPGVVTLSSMGGRPLLTLHLVAPDRLEGERLVLERALGRPGMRR